MVRESRGPTSGRRSFRSGSRSTPRRSRWWDRRCQLHRDPGAALDALDDLVTDLGEGGAARTLGATLFRLRGHGLALLGDIDQAREAFEAALAKAAEDDTRYEGGLAERALGLLGDVKSRAKGDEILSELGAESAVLPPLP